MCRAGTSTGRVRHPGAHAAPGLDKITAAAIGAGVGLFANSHKHCMSCRAPALDASGMLHMQPPAPEKVKAAITQAEVTAVSVTTLEGAEVDATFKVN